MNANIQASEIASALPIQLLFKAGDFIRVKGGEPVGRVLEDTPDENSFTRVQMFDDDPDSCWGPEGKSSFGPGCLTMWTPNVVRQVFAAPKPVLLPPIDLERAKELLMNLVAAWELVRDLGRLEMESGNHSCLPSHLQLLGKTFGDTTDEIVLMIETEERRQRDAEPVSEED